MEFRDLKTQYQENKRAIDSAMQEVLHDANFISGKQVVELEQQLADYVGVKHCISCANGTDALQLALMVWGIKEGDAVFVPDFTFFSTAEVISLTGATPIFVDVEEDTYNMSSDDLEKKIKATIQDNVLCEKVVIAVDLFGQPANYPRIREITDKYGLLLLEDGAQGFGGAIGDVRACSFGDISTTSFFPAKPLGCYGDGGAIFTDDDEWAELLKSYCVHGKGTDKYDNVRIGLNSRLDTIQAVILKEKLRIFKEFELEKVNQVAMHYTEHLREAKDIEIPIVSENFFSSWAQYTIILRDEETRDSLQIRLKENGIPSMIYYRKPMHSQGAFAKNLKAYGNCPVTERLCNRVLSLPMHPYLDEKDIKKICACIKEE